MLARNLFIWMLSGTFIVSCIEKEIWGVNHETSTVRNAANTSSVKVIYEETFEGPDPFSEAYNIEIGEWNYALQYVTKPVFEGNKAACFTIKETQPLVKNGKRAEVTIIKGENLPGRDMWYSFAAYFPSDGFAYDETQEMINQWYQDGSPATGLRINRDRFYLLTGNEMDSRKKLDLGQVTKDTWHEFVFHFIHSYGTDGLIEVWHNGTKILTHKGGNMYNVDIMPKWKIGLYKSSFKYGTSLVDKRVAYFDNIRVGNEKASLKDMNPSKYN